MLHIFVIHHGWNVDRNVIFQEPSSYGPVTRNAAAGPKSLTNLSAHDVGVTPAGSGLKFKHMTGRFQRKPSKNSRRRKLQQEAQIRNKINRIQSKRQQMEEHSKVTAQW